MNINDIELKKASTHNLKNISTKIPRNKITVITGPSGSGKSTLAFDTIYTEAQRRFIESLSSYAKSFLGQMNPPEVESITGLSPAISVDQKIAHKNPRSTVGTVTEIYSYLKVLYSKVGKLYCLDDGSLVEKYSPTKISNIILSYPQKSRVHILAPLIFSSKKEFDSILKRYHSQGFIRFKVNEDILNIEVDDFKKINNPKSLSVVIDRIVVRDDIQSRCINSIETAYKESMGKVEILVNDDNLNFSENFQSKHSGRIYPDITSDLFSFNSPKGACSKCKGLGVSKEFKENDLISNNHISINDGAIPILSNKNSFFFKMFLSVAKKENINLDLPYKKLKKSFIKTLFHGSDKIYQYSFESDNSTFKFSKTFPGIIHWHNKKYLETNSERTKKSLEEFMTIGVCDSCNGKRLNDVALNVFIEEKNIADLSRMTIKEMSNFFNNLKFESNEEKKITRQILKEIKNRLKFLLDTGLYYLSLDRQACTLSGGESQRIKLATQIGSALSGVLYVLDEPSIGLHPADNERLIYTIKNLKLLGNTIIIVEHDLKTISHADFLIDMGPGAGVHGGKILAEGNIAEIKNNPSSITGQYLSGKKTINLAREKSTPYGFIKLKGANQNNISHLDVNFPLGVLCCITGVSGSGKSTLVHEILSMAIKSHLNKKNEILYKKNNYKSIDNIDQIKSLIELTQDPIGRSPQSNPATFTGIFDKIRTIFAQTPESQIKGYKAGRFSFNVKGGRCDECEGAGVKKIEMDFLADVFVTCDECKGSRYNRETLNILYKGKNISEILNLTIEEALKFFTSWPKINKTLSTLVDMGLGYLLLGQPATTLSGGEAQRLKLAKEISKATKGHTLYILDEPTTGLHLSDIEVLLKAIYKLCDLGHSVIIIEHNTEVIKNSDYIIDLGPKGGNDGGKVVYSGPTDDIIKCKNSLTAKYMVKA